MPIRLSGVFAHPDDDAYLLGGTLLLNAGKIDLSLIFATSGEAGPISDPVLATRESLGRVREREQRRCLEIIGYGDARVEFLRHPDYYLQDVPWDDLVADIERVFAEVKPHIVITFGPDGLTSHHDHIRVGEAASTAFHRQRRSGDSEDAFKRLFYVALARSDVDRFYEGVRAGAFDYGEEGRLFDVTGVPDETIAVRIDARSVLDRKLAGMLAHETQLIEFERVPEPLRWIYTDTESFVQAWPSRDSTAVEDDLLAGLTEPTAARGG